MFTKTHKLHWNSVTSIPIGCIKMSVQAALVQLPDVFDKRGYVSCFVLLILL